MRVAGGPPTIDSRRAASAAYYVAYHTTTRGGGGGGRAVPLRRWLAARSASVIAAPDTPRSRDGFDLHWRDLADDGFVEWEEGSEGRARVGEPTLGLDDAALLDLLPEVEWTAIDAPFGWPEPMVAAVHAYAAEDRWPAPAKQSFRLRRTDLHVHDRVLAQTEEKLWPPSPSTDRIALTGWRLAGLREAARNRSVTSFAQE